MENIDNGMGVLFPFWDEGTKMVYIVGKVSVLCILYCKVVSVAVGLERGIIVEWSQ